MNMWLLKSQLPKMPPVQLGHSSCIADNEFLVLTRAPKTSRMALFCCDLDSFTWCEVKTIGAPAAREFQQSVLSESSALLIAGGRAQEGV